MEKYKNKNTTEEYNLFLIYLFSSSTSNDIEVQAVT